MPELFGTNGVRGIPNEDLTPDLVMNLTKSLSTYIGRGEIAIATDTRLSGEMLKGAAVSGIVSCGLDVIDLGTVPSPCLQYYVGKTDADSGVIVTASHNPPEYNGIKFVDSEGVEYPESELEEMESIYREKKYLKSEWYEAGEYRKDGNGNAIKMYKDAIKEVVDKKAIEEFSPTVVVDPGNGAGCFVTPHLLRELGCKVIGLNSHPDGMFPVRDPEPVPENLDEFGSVVKAVNADLGVAHDGDADRAVFADDRGRVHLGDVSLALFFRDAVEDHTSKKEIDGCKVVTPVSSGNKVADTVKECGAEITWTQVGSTVVARKMMELGDVCACGGEENGGVIFPDFQYCRDGALTAARMVEMLAKDGRTMSEMVDELPTYESVKTKIEIDNKEKVMDEVMERVEARSKEWQDVSYIDGVKAFLEDGWFLIRPSGTEPVVRIFTEASTEGKANKIASDARSIVEEAIESLR